MSHTTSDSHTDPDTDHPSDGRSKYTIPTGEGYLGVWKATNWSLTIAIGTYECVPWLQDTDVYVRHEEPGLALTADTEPEEYLCEADVRKHSVGTSVRIPARAIRNLDGAQPDAGSVTIRWLL